MYCQINLLPPIKRKVIFNVYILYYLKFFTEIILGYSAIIATIFILSFYFLNIALNDFQEKTISMDKEYQQINNEIVIINKNLRNISLAQKEITNWNQYLYQIFTLNLKGISFSGLDIQKAEKNITIQGRAATRDSLLKLQDSLNKLNFLKKIELPLSILTAKQNIDFNIKAELDIN